jgi:hypothetical protein
MSLDAIESVMRRLEPFLDEFSAIATHAHTTYRTYPNAVLVEHTTRSAANCTYDHMVAEAERRFVDRSDIRPLVLSGLKLWLIGTDSLDMHTVIRWKKMDENGRSRNYPTKQAKAFDLMDDLPGLPPQPTRVTIGYVLDASNTQIMRVQVARPNGRNVDWCAAIVPLEERVAGEASWQDVTHQPRLLG